MRPYAIVFGVLLLAVGAVWIGQGTGHIPGSFMTGVAFWAYAGGVCVLLGAGALVAALRR